ncbi:GMC oxidoreductase [Croceicoccus sp. YJ47]|uniref:GMC oxidoreductase n=1 Tax=Croceicoccus sp. YJ47 TaxID=2798724 RepID=UPI001F2EE866|nr:GMC oxidoreductase [Croceicoccus sp. YJ47]
MGSARVGRDQRSNVLNAWSQANDIPNLFVTDGAQVSSPACKNPSLTALVTSPLLR